jgi:acetate kinase
MIEVARKEFPQATHIACFDTSFHQTMPENVWRYPLPNSVATSDIRRYGFHGISCQHVVSELEPSRSKRAVIAHLGNGCSITAIKNGESVATTMGFTPIGGVIMSTRTGDIDPGLLLHLLRNGHNIDELTRAISYESGLKAIANTSDMKVIIEKASSEPRCNLALQMFCDRIAQQIGAYAVLLNGLDTVVFTGGIGEHAQVVRDRILNSLEILQPFETAIVKANEELVMKDEALRLLQEN